MSLPGLWMFWQADRHQPEPPQSAPATIETDLAMTRANLGAMRAYAEAGFSVIGEIDAVGDRLRLVQEVLGDLKPFLVVLEASPTTLEGRPRPGTDPAFVSWHARHVDWGSIPADLHISTDGVGVERTADRVRTAWEKARGPSGP